MDSCDALGVVVTMPQFMQGMLRIHGRQVGVSSNSGSGAAIATAIGSSVATAHTQTNTGSGSSTIGSGGSGTASNTGGSSTASNTGAPTTSTPTSASSSGLSTGAKIGIGVAVPLVVILLAIGAFIFFRRRKRSVQAQTDDGGLPEHVSNIAELKDNSQPPGYHQNPAEAGGNPIHEMNDNHSRGYAQEVAASPIHELNSDATNSRQLSPANTPRDESLGTSPKSEIAAVGRKPVATPPLPKSSVPAPWENSGEIPYPAPSLDPAHVTQNDDVDLKEMQEEIVMIRERKERLRSLQALDEREEQLKRKIEERKKSGGPSS